MITVKFDGKDLTTFKRGKVLFQNRPTFPLPISQNFNPQIKHSKVPMEHNLLFESDDNTTADKLIQEFRRFLRTSMVQYGVIDITFSHDPGWMYFAELVDLTVGTFSTDNRRAVGILKLLYQPYKYGESKIKIKTTFGENKKTSDENFIPDHIFTWELDNGDTVAEYIIPDKKSDGFYYETLLNEYIQIMDNTYGGDRTWLTYERSQLPPEDAPPLPPEDAPPLPPEDAPPLPPEGYTNSVSDPVIYYLHFAQTENYPYDIYDPRLTCYSLSETRSDVYGSNGGFLVYDIYEKKVIENPWDTIDITPDPNDDLVEWRRLFDKYWANSRYAFYHRDFYLVDSSIWPDDIDLEHSQTPTSIDFTDVGSLTPTYKYSPTVPKLTSRPLSGEFDSFEKFPDYIFEIDQVIHSLKINGTVFKGNTYVFLSTNNKVLASVRTNEDLTDPVYDRRYMYSQSDVEMFPEPRQYNRLQCMPTFLPKKDLFLSCIMNGVTVNNTYELEFTPRRFV